MAPNKRTQTTQGAGTLSQALQQASQTSINARNQGNLRNSLGLTNPEHVARYNALSIKLIIATWYINKGLLTSLGLLDDICWLFTRGGIGHFLETRDHTCGDVTLEKLSILNIEVISTPQCQEGYISF